MGKKNRVQKLQAQALAQAVEQSTEANALAAAASRKASEANAIAFQANARVETILSCSKVSGIVKPGSHHTGRPCKEVVREMLCGIWGSEWTKIPRIERWCKEFVPQF